MEARGRLEVLVADTGAFINGAPLEEWSSKVATVKEVVEEIRDESTRRRLQILPYQLSFSTPTHEAIQHVTSFAKKTGDYGSLSSVDLKVMALTYQLACEQDPEKRSLLRGKPAREEALLERVTIPGMVGFYKKTISQQDTPVSSCQPSSPSNQLTSPPSSPSNQSSSQSSSQPTLPSHQQQRNLQASTSLNAVSENMKNLSLAGQSGFEVDGRDGQQNERGLEKSEEHKAPYQDSGAGEINMGAASSDRLCSDGGCSDDDDDDDEEEGWITPSNFKEACAEMGGVVEEDLEGVAVGCVTTDFAMQNVLLQMGLTVISLEGMRIKQLRTYAKKCKACFKTTTNTGLRFCPKCGNRTLAKVSVTVGEDGKLRYHFLSEKQFSHRGLRYSLPLPKGGRHANNPILAPDQKVTYKQKRSRKGNVHPLHPDYIAQSSPFSMTDVTSRGAQLFFQEGNTGGKRRNPNAVRPKSKRK